MSVIEKELTQLDNDFIEEYPDPFREILNSSGTERGVIEAKEERYFFENTAQGFEIEIHTHDGREQTLHCSENQVATKRFTSSDNQSPIIDIPDCSRYERKNQEPEKTEEYRRMLGEHISQQIKDLRLR